MSKDPAKWLESEAQFLREAKEYLEIQKLFKENNI